MMGRSRSGCGQGPGAHRPVRRPWLTTTGRIGATARFAEIGRAASLPMGMGRVARRARLDRAARDRLA